VLHEILRSTKHLESLSYHYWDQFRCNPLEFDPRSFAEAVYVVGPSLRKLEIRSEGYDQITLYTHSQTLGHLHEFCQLQRLSTSFKLLMGSPTHSFLRLKDVLPHSLEILSFTDISDDFSPFTGLPSSHS